MAEEAVASTKLLEVKRLAALAKTSLIPGRMGYRCERLTNAAGTDVMNGETATPRPFCNPGLCCGSGRKIQTA